MSNLSAFLDTIGKCEGATYNTLYGGHTFTGDEHPNIAVTAGGYTSTAAGKYQILYKTWQDFKAAVAPSVPKFDKDGQDWCATWLIERRGALDDVNAGRLEDALAKASKEWASLPGSPYGQPTRSLDFCKAAYKAAGGLLADEMKPAPIEEASFPASVPLSPNLGEEGQQPTGNHMGAFLAFLPSILQAIPSLIQVFGKGDPEAVKAKADKAQVVTDLLVKATDAVNLQDAVEQIQNDPAKQAAAQAAVQQSWYMLQEVGGGIDAARQATVAQASVPLYRDRAFIISILLLILASAVIASVVLQSQWTADNRTTTLQTILNILWAVGGYFLGSSMSSAKKDDALAAKQ